MNYKTNFNSTFANRGMGLENDINETNKYYRDYDIALIYKKHTPIRITKTDYKNLRITDGFFETQSTLDYNGVYKGYYIEFDAKITNKGFLPISNIASHQLKHIERVINHGGIIFLLIMINNECYILPGKKVLDFIDKKERKSIPYSYIKENGIMLKYSYLKGVDYIKGLDTLIEEIKWYEKDKRIKRKNEE